MKTWHLKVVSNSLFCLNFLSTVSIIDCSLNNRGKLIAVSKSFENRPAELIKLFRFCFTFSFGPNETVSPPGPELHRFQDFRSVLMKPHHPFISRYVHFRWILIGSCYRIFYCASFGRLSKLFQSASPI